MFESALRVSVTPGVKERPHVPGWRYVAFVLHPLHPGPIVIAIAHVEGCKRVLDVARNGISIDDSAALLKRYGIDRITGAVDDGEGDALAHAVAGALVLAGEPT
jgi:hypothetical protein